MLLLNLPYELLLAIASNLRESDIWALVQTSCAAYNLLIDYMYQRNVKAGSWALYPCCEKGNQAAVERLLECNADVNNYQRRYTPLEIAALRKHASFIDLLLQYNPEIDKEAREYKCLALLHIVAARGHRKVARILLDHGVDINAVRDDRTPVMCAVEHGHLGMTKLLVERGAELVPPRLPLSALHFAAHPKRSNPDLIQFLVSEGLDVDARGPGGYSPLHLVRKPKHVENARQLLELGADPDILDTVSCTPLHNAIEEENEALVEVLLMHGADPNLKKETYSYQSLLSPGWYPLQKAQEKGNAKILELLRAYGAVEQNDYESEELPEHEMVKLPGGWFIV